MAIRPSPAEARTAPAALMPDAQASALLMKPTDWMKVYGTPLSWIAASPAACQSATALAGRPVARAPSDDSFTR
jgi:hypothetical protein